MKVVDFIKKLQEIGYDENTRLMFDTVNGDIGESYELEIREYLHGEDVDNIDPNIIDIEFSIPPNYIKDKTEIVADEIAEKVSEVISTYRFR